MFRGWHQAIPAPQFCAMSDDELDELDDDDLDDLDDDDDDGELE